MSNEEIRAKAKAILEGNEISGFSEEYQREFHYIKPSAWRYPYQFFWDTCFHIYSMTALGMTDKAMKSLKSLFAMQEENGFVGHIIFWKTKFPERITDLLQRKPSLKILTHPHMTALIQPPLAAQALQRIYEYSGNKEYLKEILPKVKKYYVWLSENRDFEKNGLISIITYFESGMDWKPSYDEVINLPPRKANFLNFLKVISIDLRNFLNNYNLKKIYIKNYFIVKDAGMNTIYAQNLKVLSKLCDILNDPDAPKFLHMAEQTTKSIVKFMYDEKDAAFYDIYGKENKKLKVLTPTIFFPLIIEDMPGEVGRKIIERHLFNKNEFWTPFPLPSLAINHPSFYPYESMYIWRGPTWIIFNWFLHHYLILKGFTKEASFLVESIKTLIEKSGFREYYNPFSGEGYGAYDFTWAALITDMINMEKEYHP